MLFVRIFIFFEQFMSRYRTFGLGYEIAQVLVQRPLVASDLRY